MQVSSLLCNAKRAGEGRHGKEFCPAWREARSREGGTQGRRQRWPLREAAQALTVPMLATALRRGAPAQTTHSMAEFFACALTVSGPCSAWPLPTLSQVDVPCVVTPLSQAATHRVALVRQGALEAGQVHILGWCQFNDQPVPLASKYYSPTWIS